MTKQRRIQKGNTL